MVKGVYHVAHCNGKGNVKKKVTGLCNFPLLAMPQLKSHTSSDIQLYPAIQFWSRYRKLLVLRTHDQLKLQFSLSPLPKLNLELKKINK